MRPWFGSLFVFGFPSGNENCSDAVRETRCEVWLNVKPPQKPPQVVQHVADSPGLIETDEPVEVRTIPIEGKANLGPIGGVHL